MWELLLPNQKIDQPLGVVLVWPGATQLQPCNPGEIDLELLYWALTCGRCRCPFQLLSLLRCAFFFFFFCSNAQTKSKKNKNFTTCTHRKRYHKLRRRFRAERFLNDRCILCFKWYKVLLRGGGGCNLQSATHTHTLCGSKSLFGLRSGSNHRSDLRKRLQMDIDG